MNTKASKPYHYNASYYNAIRGYFHWTSIKSRLGMSLGMFSFLILKSGCLEAGDSTLLNFIETV